MILVYRKNIAFFAQKLHSYFLFLLPNKQIMMEFQNTREFARQLDAKDKLAKYRDEFIFPHVNGKQVIYFTGNFFFSPPIARISCS